MEFVEGGLVAATFFFREEIDLPQEIIAIYLYVDSLRIFIDGNENYIN